MGHKEASLNKDHPTSGMCALKKIVTNDFELAGEFIPFYVLDNVVGAYYMNNRHSAICIDNVARPLCTLICGSVMPCDR